MRLSICFLFLLVGCGRSNTFVENPQTLDVSIVEEQKLVIVGKVASYEAHGALSSLKYGWSCESLKEGGECTVFPSLDPSALENDKIQIIYNRPGTYRIKLFAYEWWNNREPCASGDTSPFPTAFSIRDNDLYFCSTKENLNWQIRTLDVNADFAFETQQADLAPTIVPHDPALFASVSTNATQMRPTVAMTENSRLVSWFDGSVPNTKLHAQLWDQKDQPVFHDSIIVDSQVGAYALQVTACAIDHAYWIFYVDSDGLKLASVLEDGLMVPPVLIKEFDFPQITQLRCDVGANVLISGTSFGVEGIPDSVWFVALNRNAQIVSSWQKIYDRNTGFEKMDAGSSLDAINASIFALPGPSGELNIFAILVDGNGHLTMVPKNIDVRLGCLNGAMDDRCADIARDGNSWLIAFGSPTNDLTGVSLSERGNLTGRFRIRDDAPIFLNYGLLSCRLARVGRNWALSYNHSSKGTARIYYFDETFKLRRVYKPTSGMYDVKVAGNSRGQQSVVWSTETYYDSSPSYLGRVMVQKLD
jgi:hypothetical protein